MPRKPRIHYTNVLYGVMLRGNPILENAFSLTAISVSRSLHLQLQSNQT